MLNCVYRLIAPRMFEPVEIDVSTQGKRAIVRPTHLSICNADMRYYLGKRSVEALSKKLPMSLIHEGIGTVVEDPTGLFSRGDRIVLLPNNPHESSEHVAENYLSSSEFCGSGFDGFMQEYLVMPPSRLVALPLGVDANIAAFTELVSVAVHAVTRFEAIAHERRDVVGVWGDGNLGFIVALVLRMLYPDMLIVVFGRNSFKLADFTFADRVCLSHEAADLPTVDHAFECCGGYGSAKAIEQIIDLVKPEGTISLLGVSENPVPVNTRMVLEKGLRLFGSSRSGRADFLRTVQLYQEHPSMLEYLKSLVGDVIPVRTTQDMTSAFEADVCKPMGKTVMQWNV